MCLSTGTPKNINFSFETNGKLMALGVPILKHFRVLTDTNPHTKFYVATMIGAVKSTSYKNLNLSLTGSHMYVWMEGHT